MTFLYKTKKLKNKYGEKRVMIELFDFVLGNVEYFMFDDERYLHPDQQIKDRLKDLSFSFETKLIG